MRVRIQWMFMCGLVLCASLLAETAAKKVAGKTTSKPGAKSAAGKPVKTTSKPGAKSGAGKPVKKPAAGKPVLGALPDTTKYRGVRMQLDESIIAMGKAEDVKLIRTGKSKLTVAASVDVTGVVNAKKLMYDGNDLGSLLADAGDTMAKGKGAYVKKGTKSAAALGFNGEKGCGVSNDKTFRICADSIQLDGAVTVNGVSVGDKGEQERNEIIAGIEKENSYFVVPDTCALHRLNRKNALKPSGKTAPNWECRNRRQCGGSSLGDFDLNPTQCKNKCAATAECNCITTGLKSRGGANGLKGDCRLMTGLFSSYSKVGTKACVNRNDELKTKKGVLYQIPITTCTASVNQYSGEGTGDGYHCAETFDSSENIKSNGWAINGLLPASGAFGLGSVSTISAIEVLSGAGLGDKNPTKFQLKYHASQSATYASAGWKTIKGITFVNKVAGGKVAADGTVSLSGQDLVTVQFAPVRAGAVMIRVISAKGGNSIMNELKVYGPKPHPPQCATGYSPVAITSCSGSSCSAAMDQVFNANGWKAKSGSVAFAFDGMHWLPKVELLWDKAKAAQEFSVWYTQDPVGVSLKSKWLPIDGIRFLQSSPAARIDRNVVTITAAKSNMHLGFPMVAATGIKIQVIRGFNPSQTILREVSPYECVPAAKDVPCGNDWYVFGRATNPGAFQFAERHDFLGMYNMKIDSENWSYDMRKWLRTLGKNTRIEFRVYDHKNPQAMDVRTQFKVGEFLKIDLDDEVKHSTSVNGRVYTKNVFDPKVKAWTVGSKMKILRDFRVGQQDAYATHYCATRGTPKPSKWTTWDLERSLPGNAGAASFLNLFTGNGDYLHVSLCPWGMGHYKWSAGPMHNNDEEGMRASVALRVVNAVTNPCNPDPCDKGTVCHVVADSFACLTEKLFSMTKSDQTFVVPKGVTQLEVMLYGAGGGGGDAARGQQANAAGGGGGFTAGSLAVKAGEKLTIVVGEGGKYGKAAPRAYGGGGRVGHSSYNAGAGGGRSAIKRGSKDIATAGGGGGGGEGTSDGHGGGGGGLVGGYGNDPQNRGGEGATQTAKGKGGKQEGTQHQGNYSPNPLCGGGGGGYYGGGACKSGNDKGGGGGSGYVGGFVKGTGQTYLGMSGNDDFGGLNGAPSLLWLSTIGNGGKQGVAGQHGRVVIRYKPVPVPKTTPGSSVWVTAFDDSSDAYIDQRIDPKMEGKTFDLMRVTMQSGQKLLVQPNRNSLKAMHNLPWKAGKAMQAAETDRYKGPLGVTSDGKELYLMDDHDIAAYGSCKLAKRAYVKSPNRGYCRGGGDDKVGDKSVDMCRTRCDAVPWCRFFSAKDGKGISNVDCMLYKIGHCDFNKLVNNAAYVTYGVVGNVGTGCKGRQTTYAGTPRGLFSFRAQDFNAKNTGNPFDYGSCCNSGHKNSLQIPVKLELRLVNPKWFTLFDNTGFHMVSHHTKGLAAKCKDLGACTTFSVNGGLEKCQQRCRNLFDKGCDTINWIPKGATGTSKEGRCCPRNCGPCVGGKCDLVSTWKGWNVYALDALDQRVGADAAKTTFDLLRVTINDGSMYEVQPVSSTMKEFFAKPWINSGHEKDKYKLIGYTAGGKGLYLLNDHDVAAYGKCLLAAGATTCKGAQTTYSGTPQGLVAFKIHDLDSKVGGNSFDYGTCCNRNDHKNNRHVVIKMQARATAGKAGGNLYLGKKVTLEAQEIMKACNGLDTPFAVNTASDVKRMRKYLVSVPKGFYAMNAFTGPNPWTAKTGSQSKQGQLGYLVGSNWKKSAYQHGMQRFSGNANIKCGSSTRSWDPVLASVMHNQKTNTISYRTVGRGYCQGGGDDAAGDASLAACQRRCDEVSWCQYFSVKTDSTKNKDCMLYRWNQCRDHKLIGSKVYITKAKSEFRTVGFGYCQGGGDDSRGDVSIQKCEQLCLEKEWCQYASAKSDTSKNKDCMHYRADQCNEKKLTSAKQYVTVSLPVTFPTTTTQHAGVVYCHKDGFTGKVPVVCENQGKSNGFTWSNICSGTTVYLKGSGKDAVPLFFGSDPPENGKNSWGKKDIKKAWRLEWDGELWPMQTVVYIYGLGQKKYYHSNQKENAGMSWGSKDARYAWLMDWDKRLGPGSNIWLYGISRKSWLATNRPSGQGASWGAKQATKYHWQIFWDPTTAKCKQVADAAKHKAGSWVRIGKDVKWSAKGNNYGTFKVPYTLCGTQVKFVHKTGHVACRGGAAGISNFGCKGSKDIGIHLTDSSKACKNKCTIAPAPEDPTISGLGGHGWWKKNGFTSDSKQIVLDLPNKKFCFQPKHKYHLWHAEDLHDSSESDNHGTATTDVYIKIV